MPAATKRRGRPPTKPWTTEGNPWKRDMLRLKTRRTGWRPKFVSARNEERMLQDGWTYASHEHYGGLHDQLPGETGRVDTKIRRRELVLMEIPETLALQRDQHYASLADRAEKSIKRRYKKETQEVGASTYEPRLPGRAETDDEEK